jgi:hypothetical protein
VSVQSEFLERIGRYRTAVRIVIDADAPFNRKCAKLIELSTAARAEDDRELARWCERAIYEEASVFLGLVPPPPVPTDAYGRKQRAVREEGYSHCPRCGSALATEDQLALWASQWSQWAAEVDRRGGSDGE